MGHPENMSNAERMLRQYITMKQECFKLAEYIVDEAVARRVKASGDLSDSVKEAYHTSIPNLAASLCAATSSFVTLPLNANDGIIGQMHDEGERLVASLRKINKEHERR